ncbi:ATP-dependent helicase, partial [Streptomyces violarus]|nr:ATP-dependent helicase [Streptomyces violarus]
MFLPGDPARTGRIAFWRPDGEAPPTVASASVASASVASAALVSASATNLTVVVPGSHGVEAESVPAVLVPVDAALPVLTRARVSAQGHRSTVFWGAAAVHALHLVTRGLLLPG